MIKANRIFYLLINALWGIGVLISSPVLLNLNNADIWLYINTSVLILLGVLQLVGAYFLFKKKYLIPIIATCMFILSFDFTGFKFVTTTIIYFKAEFFVSGQFSLDFQLFDDPRSSIILSFREFSFKMIGVNLLAILQLAGLYFERNRGLLEKENT